MTAKIFRNAFLIGFTVLLACILLFFFIMYSNYQAQCCDILEVEAEHIAEGMQICGGKEYLAATVPRAHHMDRAGRLCAL